MAARDFAFLYHDTDAARDRQHMNRLQRGAYSDLVQLYRQYHGYTMVQIGIILGMDFESCWPALEMVMVYDPIEEKYHIPWLREVFEKKRQKSDTQRENIEKRWAKERAIREETEKKRGLNTPQTIIPNRYGGNTKPIPSYTNGNTKPIPPVTVTDTVTKGMLGNEEGGMGEEEGEREGEGDHPPDLPAGDVPTSGTLPRWREGNWDHLPPDSSRLPNRMVEIFLETFPDYPREDALDYSACLQLAYKIAEQNGWPWQSALNGHMDHVLEKWRDIVEWIDTDDWYPTKSLTYLNKDFQGLIQAKNNRKPKKDGTKSAGSPAGLGKNWGFNGADPTAINRPGGFWGNNRPDRRDPIAS